MPLHPAENRGYRELFVAGQGARARLAKLAARLGGDVGAPVASAGAALAEMLDELESALRRYDLHVERAARGGGGRIGIVRAAIVDPFLERNQGLRLAVDDLEHVTTLLGYLAGVSRARGAPGLAERCTTWERRMRAHVTAVRRAATELAADPDAAIEPLDRSPLGRAAHTAAFAFGSIGEAFDRNAERVARAVRRR
jgi:hypothetical protein